MPSHKLIMLDSKAVWPRPQSCMIAVDGIGAVHAPFSPMAAPTALIANGTGTGLGVIVPNESDPRLRLMGTCVLGTIWVYVSTVTGSRVIFASIGGGSCAS